MEKFRIYADDINILPDNVINGEKYGDDFLFTHKIDDNEVSLDTRMLRETLEGVPLNTYEVIKWIEEYLKEQYSEIQKA